MNRVLGVVLATACCVSATGLAADPDFRLAVSTLRAGMHKQSQKPDGGTEVKTDTNTLTTFPAGSLELAVFPKGYAIYIYPLQEGGALWLGKALSDTMEAGVTIGTKGKKVKDADEDSSTSVGLYYWGSMPIGAYSFETNINPSIQINNGKSTSTVAATATTAASTSKTETKSTKFAVYADAGIVVPIAKNFEYVGGLDFSYAGGDTKVKPNSGSETTVKESDLDFGIVLAKFRAKF